MEVSGIKGLINKIIYDGRPKDQDFIIFSIQEISSIGKKPIYHKVLGPYNKLIKEGDYIEVEGVSTTNEYGDQIKYENLKPFAVNQDDLSYQAKERALIEVLKSIPSVGFSTARMIVEHLDLVDNSNPLKAVYISMSGHGNQVPLISQSVAENILADMNEKSKQMGFIYETMSLSSFISYNQSLKAFESFGDIKAIKENPYLLVEINGITFQTADRVAKDIGLIKPDSPERIAAAVKHELKEAGDINGHTWVSVSNLHNGITKLIGDTVSKDEMLTIIKDCEDSIIIPKSHEDKVYLKREYLTENAIAENISRLSSQEDAFELGISKTLADYNNGLYKLGKGNIELSEEQERSVLNSLGSKVSIITGGPGVGKTTVSNSLIQALIDSGASTEDILCVAPTGKAAKRMHESTGIKAKTMHLALEFNPEKGFSRNKKNPLESSIILMDEQSMTDNALARSFLNAVPTNAHVVFIGDVNQLPSVGAGNFLKDLIESETVPVSRLTKIFRQSEGSSIITKSHALIKGDKDSFFDGFEEAGDIKALEINDHIAKSFSKGKKEESSPDQLISKMCVKRYTQAISSGLCPYDDIQALTPMRRGECGVYELNKSIRDSVNPNAKDPNRGDRSFPKIETRDFIFYEGEKIMQTKNDYKINLMNGEVGRILSINTKTREANCIFDDKKITLGILDFYQNIQPAWAITGHKSQGSEYKNVIIPLSKAHQRMMNREYLYTVMTRAKDSLDLIGDYSMIDTALENKFKVVRNTGLKDRLKDSFNLEADKGYKQDSMMGM